MFHDETSHETWKYPEWTHTWKPASECPNLLFMIQSNYRSRFSVAVALAALCTLLFLASPATAATDLESRARDIDNKLMAPCCGANTVREHDSGPAMQMRAEIRQMLAAGKSEREILDHFVTQHGEKILAMPDAHGFNLLAYLLPVGFLVFGAGFLFLALRRWQKQAPAPKVAGDGPVQELDPAYLERLRNEVERDD